MATAIDNNPSNTSTQAIQKLCQLIKGQFDNVALTTEQKMVVIAEALNDLNYRINGLEDTSTLPDLIGNSINTQLVPKVGSCPMILTGTTAPSDAPDFVGQQYIDTTNKNVYLAVGNSASSDWKLQWDGKYKSISKDIECEQVGNSTKFIAGEIEENSVTTLNLYDNNVTATNSTLLTIDATNVTNAIIYIRKYLQHDNNYTINIGNIYISGNKNKIHHNVLRSNLAEKEKANVLESVNMQECGMELPTNFNEIAMTETDLLINSSEAGYILIEIKGDLAIFNWYG